MFSLEKIVEKTSHAVAECFQLKERGYIREGYHADLVLVDLNAPQAIAKDSLLYKCQWSPFEGKTFGTTIKKTFINGNLAYDEGKFDESKKGMRLTFDR